MLKRIIGASLLVAAIMSIAAAQDAVNSQALRSAVTITAVTLGDRIRITAPASTVQMHVEVYAASGEKVLDQEINNGNVFDWQLQSGQRLPAGRYVCLVTTKSISGRLTQRLGTVNVNDNALSVEPADSAQLSAPQSQAIGPVEENSSWTVLGSDENQTPTVIAHDGTEGQLTRGRGALTFRLGDFFSGNDKEQMRLTEDGNVGIGTSKPKVKLDVAGIIRAREGVMFSDGSMLKVNEKGVLTRTSVDGVTSSSVANPQAVASTQDRIAKFIDTIGTLGDAAITETAGKVGIGTTTPESLFHLAGPSGVSGITLNTPGTHRYRFQTVPGVANWGALTLNANFNAGWLLDDTTINGWFFKLDTRGGNASGVNNGLWLYRVPSGANPHVDEAAVFGVSSTHAYFAGNVGIGKDNPAAKLDVVGNINASGSVAGATATITGNLTALTATIGSTLTVDTNTLHVDAATNRVGIGTVTPTESLHVAGNGLVTGNLGVNGNLSVAGELSAALPAGSNNYIQNSTAEQSSSDFNISGNGTAGGTLSANIVSATTQYNVGADRVLAISASNSNTFVGVGAGAANPTGLSNSFFGKNAGAANTAGSFNSFFGDSAGAANTIGLRNSFFGAAAGAANTTGQANAFFGRNAGSANATGVNNSFFGVNAGETNTTGANNSFIGAGAGDSNTTGRFNSFFGANAGEQNTTGQSNAFIGMFAGSTNTTGSNNTIIGFGANVGANNLDHATAIGADAVVSTSNTIALGRSSGADAVSVPGNLTVSGTLTATLPTGSGNYIQNRTSPQASSDFNISGSGTVGGTLSANIVNVQTQYRIGNAPILRTAGSDNIFVGRLTGPAIVDPNSINNSVFGTNAGTAMTSIFAMHNSFFGANAGEDSTTGGSNSFFGAYAGHNNTTGNFNSFFGYIAGDLNQTGSSNTFFGREAGRANTTGSQNTIIGSNADVGSNNLTFATAIGADAIVSNSDSIVLGRSLDTVRVPGKILAEANAGAAVGVGEYYRDNAIVAWARISVSGTATSKFGISTVAHPATGVYTITLTASAAGNTLLIPVAIAEIDSAPTSAATLRIVSINQTSANSFQVFINNGTGALVDNDFIFIATAR